MWLLHPLPIVVPLTAGAGWSTGTVMTWLAGLLCGVVIMVALSTDWQRLPAYLRLLGRVVSRNAGWTALAAASFAVIVFY